MPINTETPPDDLSPRAAALWLATLADADPTAADVELLTEACRALDRADDARRHITEHGVVIADRYGTAKSNPAVDIERTARAFFAQTLKTLGCLSADEPTASVPRGRPGPKPRNLKSA